MATEVANQSSMALAMAFAGRSARACDVCAHKGAHWFCAADDAYLCTGCDTQVHSANALSLRHERVRLSANGTPMKSSSACRAPKTAKVELQDKKKPLLHPSPPQVAPVRKRSRTARPYSHHLKKLTQVVKSEPEHHQSELELFDFLDGDVEFLVSDDGNQEVPCMGAPTSSSELDFLSSPECDEFHHSASADSFGAVFKSSKAAHSPPVAEDSDQFLVPDGVPESLPGDAFFFPGDIPGLSAFDEVDLSDDFSMSFDLALQNTNEVEAFEGENGGNSAAVCKVEDQSQDEYTVGPFAKFFATKSKDELMEPMSPKRIASQAREILQCCRSEDEVAIPSLQLNLNDVLTTWAGRGNVWIHPTPEDSKDVGIVPDMGDTGATADDSQSGADRDARVLRYKEKRRTRLFSKKIRYEVRKLNAERRPRMKGRFVKRTATTAS